MTTREARKSKGIYGKWNDDNLKLALAAVKDGIGVNEAARMYNIPKTTLKRYVKAAPASVVRIGHPTDLPVVIEKKLIQHLLLLENMFYGLSRKDVMKLAFEIAERNEIKTRFNSVKTSAGKEWFEGFMKRYPELSLRLPELTSQARASGFNKVIMYKFFYVLEKIVDEHQITADKIFNMDETSHTVGQHSGKIMARKGKQHAGAVTSCELGQNVTGVYAVSASGFYIPPMLIYPRKRMKKSLSFGAPPGTIFCCQEKGWMSTEVFCQWIDHFVAVVKPSVEAKILLILDGKKSHTQSLAAIELAQRHGIVMLSLPSHCVHKMQPLGLSFFKALNTFMGSAIETQMRQYPGRQVTTEHIAALVGIAFPRAASVETAVKGFRDSGLWPVDRYIFTDADFAP